MLHVLPLHMRMMDGPCTHQMCPIEAAGVGRREVVRTVCHRQVFAELGKNVKPGLWPLVIQPEDFEWESDEPKQDGRHWNYAYKINTKPLKEVLDGYAKERGFSLHPEDGKTFWPFRG